MKREINEELLTKFLLGEANPEECARVEEWIVASPDHAKKYADFKLIWESSKRFALHSKVDEHEAWERFKQRIEIKESKHVSLWSQIPHWLRVAATFVLASIGLWISYSVLIRPMNRYATITVQTLNETKLDTLPDGSVITLNKNTRLSYPAKFSDNNRKVTLTEGEAFFNVVHDVSRPFIVRSNDVQVKVLGTSFNLRTVGDHTELIVETGIVEVSQQEIVIRLHRNEMVDIDQSTHHFEKELNTDQLYKYYRSNEFIADDTPLWRLVEVLSEAYNVHIIIEGETLQNMRLNTTFTNKSLDTILNIIGETLNIRVDRQGDRIVLHH